MCYTFEKVTYRYHYDSSDTITDLSLEVGSGVSTVLVDMQSGKSTLTKLMLGIEKPTSGTVKYNGELVEGNHASKNIALIDKRHIVIRGSVLKNIMYPLIVRGTDKKQAKKVALEHLLANNLQHLATIKVGKLQLGDLIDVLVARATLRSPEVVICDGLADEVTAEKWQQIVSKLSKCSSVINLCSDIERAVGTVHVVHDNKVIFSGDNFSPTVLNDKIWLYSRDKEN